MTISVCMIVKNEEEVLERCLSCITSFADEIIIVDTGSTDKTKEIALKFTPFVYDFEWIDDFAAARNFSFSKATKNFCMWLDADDIITQENQLKLIELKKNLLDNIEVVMMPYHTSFDAQGNVTFSYYRERMVKNNKGYLWAGRIHEVIHKIKNVAYEEIAVEHHKEVVKDPNRNLRIFESMIQNGENLDARGMYYYGRELYYHQQYAKSIQILLEFLNRKDGWIENKIEACHLLSICYKNIKEENQEILILFHSFLFDIPRAEICCDIGDYFFQRNDYKKAIYWYEEATKKEINLKSGGFITNDCYHFIPYLQLCVCYYRSGDLEKSYSYHSLSEALKPEHPAVQLNKNFFETLTITQPK